MRPMTAQRDAARHLKGLRVLIVEDESLLALLLEDMLTELGCEVVGSAATVAEAIEAIAGAAPDVTILDIKLGTDKSFPVAEALAARGLPFVFATGYGDGQVDDPWRDRQVLQKPFVQDQLADALARALKAQRA
jgi:CheY-like chemotaxis protein